VKSVQYGISILPTTFLHDAVCRQSNYTKTINPGQLPIATMALLSVNFPFRESK